MATENSEPGGTISGWWECAESHTLREYAHYISTVQTHADFPDVKANNTLSSTRQHRFGTVQTVTVTSVDEEGTKHKDEENPAHQWAENRNPSKQPQRECSSQGTWEGLTLALC